MIRFGAAFIVAIGFVALAGAVRPAAAIEYPWCAQYSGGEDGGGGRNCGFSTWEQCMETVRGMGGSCEHNLFYEGPAQPNTKPVRKRKKGDG